MSSWLLKTEPTTYSFTDLQQDGRTTWDGVSNPGALINLRAMKAGDEAFIYHTGKEKTVVGIAKVLLDDRAEGKVTLAPLRTLATPVTLAAIKGDKAFKEFLLVKNSRLSAMPVSGEHWKRILKLGS